MEIAVIFDRVEEIAVVLWLSRSELYFTALTEFICEQRDAHLTKRSNRVYGAADSSLGPGVQQLPAASLPVGQWSWRVARSGGRTCRSQLDRGRGRHPVLVIQAAAFTRSQLMQHPHFFA